MSSRSRSASIEDPPPSPFSTSSRSRIAAEITTAAGDFSELGPMIETALDELRHAGVTDKPSVVVADAQYWNEQHMDALAPVTAPG